MDLTLLKFILAFLWPVAFVSADDSADVDVDAIRDDQLEELEVDGAHPMVVTFVNELPDSTITLYWENHDLPEDDPERRRLVAELEPRGGYQVSDTFYGHEFSYELDGERHYTVPPLPRNDENAQHLVLIGHRDNIRVRCKVTTDSQRGSDNIDILVKPYWSPRGASRFLDLVRRGYYDGVALFRAVPEFLVQFGIAVDYETRTNERGQTIFDDENQQIPFEPGFVSFAGSGPDSRTTEIFIVMPGTSQHQLDFFGTNSWETPFAVLDGSVESGPLTKIYTGYGDMPPSGTGPDSSHIYEEDGYTSYLPENFPDLDYIDYCFVVDEEAPGGDEF